MEGKAKENAMLRKNFLVGRLASEDDLDTCPSPHCQEGIPSPVVGFEDF
jgi:hypothetical protein